MPTTPNPEKLRVVIAGGGVAALETVLALAHLAPELTDVILIAPNPEFVYRPMTVCEPFAHGAAARYPLQRIASDAGAELRLAGCGGPGARPVRAGVAGALYAHQKSVMQPDGFGFIHSIDFVVMVILGGMGNTAGGIVAAVVLTLLPEFLRQFASYRMILYSLLIIGLMMARQYGWVEFWLK